MSTTPKPRLSHAERGRLGGQATARKHGRAYMQSIGRWGGCNLVEKYGPDHMARIGAKGFATYTERHHGGNTERAIFALARGGRLNLSWPQGEPPQSYCLKCNVSYVGRCPRCGGDPIPF